MLINEVHLSRLQHFPDLPKYQSKTEYSSHLKWVFSDHVFIIQLIKTGFFWWFEPQVVIFLSLHTQMLHVGSKIERISLLYSCFSRNACRKREHVLILSCLFSHPKQTQKFLRWICTMLTRHFSTAEIDFWPQTLLKKNFFCFCHYFIY